LNEAQESFQEDQQHYPDDFARWGDYWQGKIQSKFSPEPIKKQIDSVFQILESDVALSDE